MTDTAGNGRRVGAGFLGGNSWIRSGVGGMALLLFLMGCGASAPDSSLVVYSAGPREMAQTICQAFEEKTGITTRLFSATTGEIMAKLQAEEFRPTADVVILAGQTAAEVLKEQGALAKLPDGDYLRLNPDWNDPDGYYAATGATALGVAVRRERYDPSLDWEGVFNGGIPGNLIMPAPSQSGSSQEFVIGFQLTAPEKFWKGMRQAKQQGLQVSGPNSQALTSLILGAHEAVVGAADYLVFRQIERGEPLAMHFPSSGCVLSLRPIGIMARTKNPEAAASFVQFYFTPKVQGIMAAAHLLPADSATPLSEVRQSAPPLHPILVDVKAAREAQRGVLRKFRTEIELGLVSH